MDYKKYISWSLVLFWMLMIFFLSAQVATESSSLSGGITKYFYNIVTFAFSGFSIDILHLIIRKLAHFVIYLVLGILVMNALNQHGKALYYSIRIALLICLLYAASDEFHQLFVDGRSGQLIDVLLDFMGSFIGVNILNGYIKANHSFIRS